MDWQNERYVRVYVRDTADLLAVGWKGRAVLWELMRKADRAGVVEGDADTLPDLLRMPADVVADGLAALVRRGCVELGDLGYVLPNFLEAQEARQSDRQRQRESRARRRARARGAVTKRDNPSRNVTAPGDRESRNVTGGDAGSRRVTPRHSSLAEPSLATPSVARARETPDPTTTTGECLNPEADSILAELRRWPALRQVATVKFAEGQAHYLMTGGRKLEAIGRSIEQAAEKAANADAVGEPMQGRDLANYVAGCIRRGPIERESDRRRREEQAGARRLRLGWDEDDEPAPQHPLMARHLKREAEAGGKPAQAKPRPVAQALANIGKGGT